MEGCRDRWLLFGLCFFGFFFGRIVTYLWVSHKTLVAKSWSGGFKKCIVGCV